MTERLIIRNFAGLDEIDIELGRINIFIGPQASGKSVCIKCLYFFKGFINQLLAWAVHPDDSSVIEELVLKRFSSLFDLTNTSSNYTLRYQIGNVFIQIQGTDDSFNLTYSPYYSSLFEQAKTLARQPRSHDPVAASLLDISIQQRFQQEAAETLGPLSVSTQTFVPASRALYALADPTITIGQLSTDSFLAEFGRFYQYMRREFPYFHDLQSNKVTELGSRVLRGRLLTGKKQEDYLIQDNGQKTRLINSSSGQQEVVPLVLTLEYLAWSSNTEKISYIEEPEAHLHPEGQRDIVNLMAAVYNERKTPLQLFLTTHSPYILTAFNNLIYAGHIHDLHQTDAISQAKLDNIVSKELQLYLADFRVYALENGRATLLIDEDTGLIRADSIDKVSDVTAEQFGDLMALDPTTQA